MDLQQSIVTLSERGWSQRRIARELGVNRETVARYRGLVRTPGAGGGPMAGVAEAPAPEAKPAIPPTGSSGAGSGANPAIASTGAMVEPPAETVRAPEPNPAILPTGSRAGRISQCEPYRVEIEAALERGLSAQRIYQDLRESAGFVGGYDAVKRFVRALGQVQPLPFRRMESAPGQEAQVDFGQGAWVVEEGRRRRPHVLRLVLSCSRKGYTEAFWQQTTENFIRGLENAFRHWGGVPATLVIDYVPRHIIDVLFPPRICGRPRPAARKLGKRRCVRSHHFYRALSHFTSSASSRQMGFRGDAPEETEAGGWHACNAASFIGRLISA
jgi:transposase-like protein